MCPELPCAVLLCSYVMFICYESSCYEEFPLTNGTARGLSRTKGYHVAVDAISVPTVVHYEWGSAGKQTCA